MLTVRQRPFFVRFARELFFTCTRPLQVCYWFMFRPYRPGAKTFIFYHNKILLVRLGYAHQSWVLPGGGVERGESPEKAALREVSEEVGITLDAIEHVGERFNTLQYKKVNVSYFVAHVTSDEIVIDGQEIIDANWFLLDALPDDVRPRLREEIEMYNTWKYEHR